MSAFAENKDATDAKPDDTALYADSDTIVEDNGQEVEGEVTVIYLDSEILGLSGAVESASYKRDDGVEPYLIVKFNENGSIVVPDDIKIFRDERNRITKYERYICPDHGDNEEYTFRYSGASNKPTYYGSSNMGSNSTNEIEYSKDGNISKLKTTANFEGEEEPMEITLTYTVLEKDYKGNWTRRRVYEETIENYMIENALGEYSPRQHIDNRSYVETRNIKYRVK